MPAIQAVIFDLGRVLVDIDLSRGLFRRLTQTRNEPPDAVLARLSGDDLFRRYCAGDLTPAAFHAEVNARLGMTLSFEEFASVWCDIFLPMAGMEALFAEIEARVRVGLLSDTDPLHWEHLRRQFPMLQRIAAPTLSYQVRAAKPDPRMFAAAARNVGAPPASCFYTDDLPTNIEAAERAGMQAMVFRGAAALREELRQRGLAVKPASCG